jgi:hypothetical protein
VRSERKIFARPVALVVGVSMLMTLAGMAAADAAAEDATPEQRRLAPDACTGMALPSGDGDLDEENHASIRLDPPEHGVEVAVDANGEISIAGVLHKQASMVDVSVGHVTTADFTLGPPGPDETAWAASWTTSLRPPELGENLICTRAEREPSRHARVLRALEVVDLIPPSNVPSIQVGEVTDTTATVTWAEATDNYGLAGYDVSIDGGPAQRSSVGSRSFTFTGLAPLSSHTVSVVAVDLAGNISETPATIFFTTEAPAPPPAVDPELSLDVGEGGVDVTWTPAESEVGYRTFLDGERLEEFDRISFCQDASGEPADPCTAEHTIFYPVAPLESATGYELKIEALDADGQVARTLSGQFETLTVEPDVPYVLTQKTASEASQCAGRGGDFYVTLSLRGDVPVPEGSTELFPGCYIVADATCIDSYLPTDGNHEVDCSDDITDLFHAVAPPGGGPVISHLGAASETRVGPVAWCIQGACASVLAPPDEAQKVLQEAARIIEQEAQRLAIRWIVVGTTGTIGVGVALGVVVAILWPPTAVGISGLLEYPIHYYDNFDTFDNWHLGDDAFEKKLKIYSQTVTTTKDVAAQKGVPFAWTDLSDSDLKEAIDLACQAQQGTVHLADCADDVAVYVPGGKNFKFKPMQETGRHIADSLIGRTASGVMRPERFQWFNPARSKGGRLALAAGHDRDWYYMDPQFQTNACTNPTPGVIRTPGKICDEFPFWVTNQAVDLSQAVNGVKPVADVKLVPSTEMRPQGSDISSFYRKCTVDDTEKFIVLPVQSWVAAGGPSFGFRLEEGSASTCMVPSTS